MSIIPPPAATTDVPAITVQSHPYDARLLAVSTAGFCVFLSVYATQSLLPMLRELFHTTEIWASMTVTATTVAVAISAPVVGLLSERIGRRTVIVSSIFLLSIPTFLAAAAPTLAWLILWRFVQGLIMPGIIAVTMAYASEEWPASQVGSAMSAYVTGNVLGGVTGRLLAGWIGAHWGWHAVFVALGLLDLLGGWFVYHWLPRSRAIRPQESLTIAFAEMRRHLHNPRLISAFAVGFNVLLILVASFTYVAYHLAGPPFHLGPAALGSLFLVYLFGVVVTPWAGRYIDQHGHRLALMIAMTFAMSGMTLTLIPHLASIICGMALCCSGIFVAQSATASYMSLAAGQGKGSASGLYATFYYTGGAAGAFVPGLFWSHGGWTATVVFILLIGALAITIATLTWQKRAIGH